ncbi:raffinose/stachyose/melibiose transport system permease protein [Anaerocolumna jejuensis DSM 15929]|uniref:Raffinose/stachyose/melibiose transport system permease protein n=1 Tax=Anaerocolumna jejuensis DSM 15929 TaxID=1121322 RepID=A0A1M6JE18_9FIRM|nr:carbohydrate ABC transporter permease [Anaerocolumna jejuensis]SHJ44951.1 raffinose/stachyose/melibiose transport system permease protein [Anaerocolumna jejuensis DSM 15929]
MEKKKRLSILADILGILGALIIFVIPFLFMLVNSLKDRRGANLLRLSLPETFQWKNYTEVITANNGIIFTAFKNSLIISLGSVLVLIIACAMAGYVLQRRKDKVMSVSNVFVMAGLMVPPAILPTISIMQNLHVYKTLFGMIMVEVALQIPFTIMLYRGFMSSIPVELEEAGYIDGCTRSKLFISIVLPLLKPVTATVTILNAVTIFNDFTNPLYFLPGNKNATVQLTLYNFMGQFSSSYGLLFADVIIITIPMILLFIFFNKKIVDGMTAGAVKG